MAGAFPPPVRYAPYHFLARFPSPTYTLLHARYHLHREKGSILSTFVDSRRIVTLILVRVLTLDDHLRGVGLLHGPNSVQSLYLLSIL